jgi:hypothetical protein
MKKLATCTTCEAACGIVVEVDGDRVTGVRGDPDDPMSRGYVCPKVVAMPDLHENPDRLSRPLVREGSGFRETSWEDALIRAARGLRRVRREHGKDVLAIHQGNPTAHNLGLMTVGQVLLRTLGTKNVFSASTADQVPHMRAAHDMFGHVLFMPVPDIERTDLWLLVGANPVVSNGSIMTAPDVRRRIHDLRARGGKLVVVDPRRTETAALADRHVFLRPGTDPLFSSRCSTSSSRRASHRRARTSGRSSPAWTSSARAHSGSLPSASARRPAWRRTSSAKSRAPWHRPAVRPATCASGRATRSTRRWPRGSRGRSPLSRATSIARAGSCGRRRPWTSCASPISHGSPTTDALRAACAE